MSSTTQCPPQGIVPAIPDKHAFTIDLVAMCREVVALYGSRDVPCVMVSTTFALIYLNVATEETVADAFEQYAKVNWTGDSWILLSALKQLECQRYCRKIN